MGNCGGCCSNKEGDEELRIKDFDEFRKGKAPVTKNNVRAAA